jgi:hypothetical protein
MFLRYQKEGKLIQIVPIHQLAELFGLVMMLTLFEVVYADKAPLDIEEHVNNFLKSNRPQTLE